MRALQASFPRLKDRMLYEEKGEHQLIMNLIVFLIIIERLLLGSTRSNRFTFLGFLAATFPTEIMVILSLTTRLQAII
jgi:hypothetical protein